MSALIVERLETLQQQVDQAKLKLAELNAKEKLLEEQKAVLLIELNTLGIEPKGLHAAIEQLEIDITKQLDDVQMQLTLFPPELLR